MSIYLIPISICQLNNPNHQSTKLPSITWGRKKNEKKKKEEEKEKGKKKKEDAARDLSYVKRD